MSGHKDAPVQLTNVDGPAFAYYMYDACMASRQTASSSFEAIPSYSELKDRTLTWLDRLDKKIGLRLDFFYFDGLLPVTKRNTRMSRLEGFHRQLSDYVSEMPRGVPNTIVAVDQSNNQRRKALPPPPFLVPAIIEALLVHPIYKDRFQVIPGEADFCCAKQKEPMIFTGDSDLLVYDLGDNGSVVFFDDLEEAMSEDGKHTLKGLVYRPRAIAERLGLLSIKDLAYELRKYPSVSFRQALARAKEHTEGFHRSRPYEMWQVEYNLDKEFDSQFPLTVLRHHSQNLALQTALGKLDPRVSECIMQYGCQSLKVQPCFYCPVLTDDPRRASSWDPGLPLRRLAYALPRLALHKKQRPEFIHEVSRRGQSLRSEQMVFLSLPKTVKRCRQFLQNFKDIGTMLSEDIGDEKDLWRAFGLDQVVGWYTSSGKIRPNISYFKGLVVNQGFPKMEWSQIHLLAQFHGVLYSARILKQFAEIAYHLDDGHDAVMVGLLNSLNNVLGAISSIDALFIAPKDMPSDQYASQRWDNIIQAIYQYRRVPERENMTDQDDILRLRIQKKAESQAGTLRQPLNKQSNNRFNILDPG